MRGAAMHVFAIGVPQERKHIIAGRCCSLFAATRHWQKRAATFLATCLIHQDPFPSVLGRRRRVPRVGQQAAAAVRRAAQRTHAPFWRCPVPPRPVRVPPGRRLAGLPGHQPRGDRQRVRHGRPARRRQLRAHRVRHRRGQGQGAAGAVRAPAGLPPGARAAPHAAHLHVSAAGAGRPGPGRGGLASLRLFGSLYCMEHCDAAQSAKNAAQVSRRTSVLVSFSNDLQPCRC